MPVDYLEIYVEDPQRAVFRLGAGIFGSADVEAVDQERTGERGPRR